MNRFKLLFLALAAIMTTACSDDDDNNSTNPATEVAGTYQGYTVAKSQYFSSMVAPDQKVTLTATATGTIDVDFTSDTWGQISVKGATVSKSGNEYLLTGNGTSVMGQAGQSKEYDCTFTGKIISGMADLSFSCPAVMGGLTINFLQGEIPADIVVAGTYSGWTKADCQYFKDMYAEGQKLTVTADADGTFTVKYTSDTWGEFTVSGVTATLEGNNFNLSGNGTCTMGMNGNVNNYACTFSGKVDVEKNNPAFQFDVPAVMGGLTILFKTGEMPSTAN
ncbi:MAG: calycin-like domain-containing protein [Muribaculaceae bacterium]|nr:calycin-like domain-containing protein [Muribaculaceae bacterium]